MPTLNGWNSGDVRGLGPGAGGVGGPGGSGGALPYPCREGNAAVESSGGVDARQDSGSNANGQSCAGRHGGSTPPPAMAACKQKKLACKIVPYLLGWVCGNGSTPPHP